ncbi:predicted protein [Streptomyces viridochromogenes DSM 40736]|uniref:Predicted protein n=1 Tax=Streptomyces viridochromogenes (strain DSM 40736 / JCM 4977 / BCRC 1201 / Tue 494) TaxID=591159 RepID=D9XDS8_STRVT|nr:predicted protein [Streptomyces viridochromogenes DSM 40736]
MADADKDNPQRSAAELPGVSPPARAVHLVTLPGRPWRTVTHARNARILINARFSSEQRMIPGASEAKHGSFRRGTQAGGACD